MLTKDEKKPQLPNSNVLYYELENNCWCCVRPSGTEPKIKFYIGVKEKTEEEADNAIKQIKEELLKYIEK